MATRRIWTELGAILAHRARLLSDRDGRLTTAGRKGFFLPDDLRRRCGQAGLAPSDDSDSVFDPLVQTLFDSNFASWVCLGQFRGTGVTAERSWMYFLSNAFRKESRLLEAVSLFSLNAELRKDFTSERFLLTTELLDTIAQAARNKDPRDDPGRPLLLDLGGVHRESPAAWAPHVVQFRSVSDPSASQLRRQVIRAPAIQGWLTNQLSDQSRGSGALIPFLGPEHDKAFSVLKDVSKRYLSQLTSDSGSLSGAEVSSLDKVLRDALPDLFRAGATLHQKLCAYVGWLLDIEPRTKSILTIPAWLPAGKSRNYSAALTVCFRRIVDNLTIQRIVGAFHQGVGPVVARSGEEEGEQRVKFDVAHQASPAVDSVVFRLNRLPRETLSALPPLLLADIAALKAVIDSYKTQGTADAEDLFPFAWSPETDALEVYRDLGIGQGLARAKGNIKLTRFVMREETETSHVEKFRPCFELISEMARGEAQAAEVRRLGFGVLATLLLRQSFYHAFRRMALEDPLEAIPALIEVSLRYRGQQIELCVANPPVPGDQDQLESKDASELKELAHSLSTSEATYSVDGPIHVDRGISLWRCKLRFTPMGTGAKHAID